MEISVSIFVSGNQNSHLTYAILAAIYQGTDSRVKFLHFSWKDQIMVPLC